MLDQRVVLLDFLPLVKLKKGVFNYITKRRRNGLSPSGRSYHVCDETDLVSLKLFPNPIAKNL
jgi:hypothetical protein